MCDVVKIEPRMWNQERFATLSEKAKLMFLFLWTHPQLTALGVMRGTLPGLAEELNWSVRKCQDALAELSIQKLVRWCELSYLVWLPGFLKVNAPESPEAVEMWEGLADRLPEGVLRNEMLRALWKFMHGLGEEFVDRLPIDLYPPGKVEEILRARAPERAAAVEGLSEGVAGSSDAGEGVGFEGIDKRTSWEDEAPAEPLGPNDANCLPGPAGASPYRWPDPNTKCQSALGAGEGLDGEGAPSYAADGAAVSNDRSVFNGDLREGTDRNAQPTEVEVDELKEVGCMSHLLDSGDGRRLPFVVVRENSGLNRELAKSLWKRVRRIRLPKRDRLRLPRRLRTDLFRESWKKWESYLQGRMLLLDSRERSQHLQVLGQMGAEASVLSIERSIELGLDVVVSQEAEMDDLELESAGVQVGSEAT